MRELSSEDISCDFVKRTLKQKGLSKKYRKRQKGGSSYMLYPTEILSSLGNILLQIDFIGPRYLKGSSEPLHFLSCKYVRPFKLHFFVRIPSQKSTDVLNVFYKLFFLLELPLPDIVQMDNDSAFRGFIERVSCLGRVPRWLCNSGIIPIYNAPNSPWNNGSVEGGNSVFDRKFWKKYLFESLEEVDEKLQEFNQAYKAYLVPDYGGIARSQSARRNSLLDPRTIKSKLLKISSQPYIYLLRIVKERWNKSQVEALNNYISLPDKYKGQFVLIEINILLQSIKIFQEIENETVEIYKSGFYINM